MLYSSSLNATYRIAILILIAATLSIFLFTPPINVNAALQLPMRVNIIGINCTQSPGGISHTEIKWWDYPNIMTGTAKNDLFKWQNNSWVLANYNFGQAEGYSGQKIVFSVAFATTWWTSSGWTGLGNSSLYYLNTGTIYCS